MAVFVPAYLVLSRHHVWYFRWPLPASLHPQGKARHVRLSLGTRDPKQALRLAKRLEYHAVTVNKKLIASNMSHADAQRALRSFFSQLLEQEKHEIDITGGLSEEQIRRLQHGVSSIQDHLLEGDKNPLIKTDIDDELTNNLIEFVRRDIPDIDIPQGTAAHDKFKKDAKLAYLGYCKELLLYNNGLNSYDFSTAPAMQNTQPHKAGKKLKETIEDFVAERMRGEEWSQRTKEVRAAQLTILCEIFGDNFDITLLDVGQAAAVKKTLQALPKNRNKNPKTKGLPLQEALKVQDMEKLHIKTVNDYLTTHQSLFAWAENQGFIQRNPFGKLTIRNKRTQQGKRNAFTREQVKTILAALPQFTPTKCGKSYPYWGTLIGIYTGARVNEIAQLSLDDIKQENGIWYFDLNDEGEEKQLKNVNSKRRVPVHAALLSLGILEHVEKLKKEKQQRLFPDLKHKKGYGYGRAISRWANEEFLVTLGIKSKELSFHSFRHAFVTYLRQSAVELPTVQELVGHSKAVVTEEVYNHAYPLPMLKTAIDKLSYE